MRYVKLCVLHDFTLFPDKVLPVKSSLLMLKENPSGRFEIFHGWIGVFRCASYQGQRIIPVLRKMVSVTNKTK